MSWPYSQIKTAVTGDILTATDYNNEHQNHITNNDPSAINDDSATVTAMKATTDPGESGTESLATTLDGEIQRLRFALVDLKGTSFWYQTPTNTLAQMLPLSGGTMTGNIAMGSHKLTGLAAASGTGDSVRYDDVYTAALANIPMNSHKLTGLAAGSAAGDSLRFEQMKVVQIVSVSTATATTTSSTSFTDATNMTVTITPTSASNKVFIIVSGVLAAAVSGKASYATIVRGSTNLGDTTSGFMTVFSGSSTSVYSGASMTYLDSPATTSATTYKVQIHCDASGSAIWGDTGNQKTITVVEVA